MDNQEYIRLAEQVFARVAEWLEGLDPDEIDYSAGDGVINIEFSDGARFILSRQSATRQIWYAAAAAAWHFDWDGARGCWVSDKDGHALFERIAETVSEKLGRKVAF